MHLHTHYFSEFRCTFRIQMHLQNSDVISQFRFMTSLILRHYLVFLYFEGMSRGVFIVFEGIDGCGKSTQFDILSQTYYGLFGETVFISFPFLFTPIGRLIDDILHKRVPPPPPSALHLLFSANRHSLNEYIKEMLLSGKNVFCNRYVHSGMAYTCAQENFIYDLKWCEACEEHLIKPDLVIYFDIDVINAVKRKNDQDDLYDGKIDFLERVSKVYKTFFSLPFWVNIDANGSKEEVSKEVIEVLNDFKKKEISSLSYF